VLGLVIPVYNSEPISKGGVAVDKSYEASVHPPFGREVPVKRLNTSAKAKFEELPFASVDEATCPVP
jgi:hypothetical protein